MIEHFLKVEGLPASKSTICHVLNNRRKAIKRRSHTIKKHRRRYELDIPGQRIQLDVKYVPEFVDGRRIYNYVAVDECTRWRFTCAYEVLNELSTEDFLDRLIRKCPFPINCIQTDNGFEFTYWTKRKKEHLMESWCKRYKIRHKRIPPGEKELNGKVERSHRTDEQYYYWRAPTDSLRNFRFACNCWIDFYNSHRPHGGLEYQTPLWKLIERYSTLKELCFLDPKLEAMRIKFLAAEPIKIVRTKKEKTDSLIEELEKALKIYNDAA